ncbi:MAG: hypothetical protein GX254_01400 [Clostridiales bacterium]|nr:hypothetical protein [Clostridiales bacterium]
MNIAVACDGRGLSDLVSEHFASCKYLLVVDMDTMSVKAIENIYDKEGTELARIVNEHSCEAVITGQLTPEAFDILADEHVTRYRGNGMTADKALMAMERQGLRLIKNADGTDECQVEHGHGTNACSDHN